MKTICKIGFAFCGSVALTLVDYFRGLDVELVAVADPNPARREKILSFNRVRNAYDNYREMLEREKLDLVICAKDMNESLDDYAQIAKDCLLAGAWAFVERPVSTSSAQVRELIELQEKTSCYVSARFHRRFSTPYLLAHNAVYSNEFGKPLLFSIKGDTAPYPTEIDFIDKHLSHYLDLAAMYFNNLSIVHVNSLSIGPQKYGYQISLSGEGGVIGTIQSVSFQSQAYPIERLEILSDGKAIIVENASEVYFMQHSDVNTSLSPSMEESSNVKSFIFNRAHMATTSIIRFTEYFGELLDCIRDGRKPTYHMEHVLPTVMLLEDFKKQLLQAR